MHNVQFGATGTRRQGDGEVDVADKEAINLLRWMRRHHLSIRALKGLHEDHMHLAPCDGNA